MRLATAILIFFTVVGAATPASAVEQRAMWVWDGPVEGVIEFSVSRSITDLYLHAPPGFSAAGSYEDFLGDAQAAGIRVHAMAGDPAWAKQGGPWRDWVDEVVAHGGFDGLVFDVEPYLHSDWGTKKQGRLIRSYLTGLDRAADRAGALPVLTAVPFWWDDLRFKGKPLVQSVLAESDGIVVMAYRDHAEGVDGIIEHSADEAALVASMGGEFVIGVETGPAGLDKVSFAEEGESYMEGQLELVESQFATASGFGGIAIHHYSAYSTMSP